jgi:hypothetical protein
VKTVLPLILCPLLAGLSCAAPRSPPTALGPQVTILNEHMPLAQIQSTLNAIANQQIDNQFGPRRDAILFEPGHYGSAAHPLNFQVGYYTAVAGLGARPDAVVITGTVQVRNRCFNGACLALDNFWRSLSNLTLNVQAGEAGCFAAEIWAVSQAAPVRRIKVTGGDFKLTDVCSKPSFASGGFIADSEFEGTVANGGQQQFLVRNSRFAGWSGGNWNQVFLGVQGAPASCFPAPAECGGPYTTLDTSSVTREAPFLYLDAQHHYRVFVPSLTRNTRGISWAGRQTPGESIGIDSFYIATPKDSAATINAELAKGRHLLLTPGVYALEQSILITRDDTVVLGLGFATLLPQNGVVAMKVSAIRGVSLSGLLFDAGAKNSPVLLSVGESGHGEAAADDPIALHDVFFRIGGAQQGKAAVSLLINEDHVLLDHIWAWRADHGDGVGWTQNTADTGLIVNGKHVTAYGLFVEHYQHHEVLWHGDDGRIVFFQNEMPYDPPSPQEWSAPGMSGWAALKVDDTVGHFHGDALGSYSYFNRGVPIQASSAFVVPPTLPAGSLHNAFTIFLNASASGGIMNVINEQGGASTAANPDIPVVVLSYP